jgi:hypothetical protein
MTGIIVNQVRESLQLSRKCTDADCEEKNEAVPQAISAALFLASANGKGVIGIKREVEVCIRAFSTASSILAGRGECAVATSNAGSVKPR